MVAGALLARPVTSRVVRQAVLETLGAQPVRQTLLEEVALVTVGTRVLLLELGHRHPLLEEVARRRVLGKLHPHTVTGRLREPALEIVPGIAEIVVIRPEGRVHLLALLDRRILPQIRAVHDCGQQVA